MLQMLYSLFWAIPLSLNLCADVSIHCPIFVGHVNKKSNYRIPVIVFVHMTYEDGTDSVSKCLHINSDSGDSPKRKKITRLNKLNINIERQ
jgi:hypothetical protein